MENMKIVRVIYGDWIDLYAVETRHLTGGHSVDERSLLEALGHEVETLDPDAAGVPEEIQWNLPEQAGGSLADVRAAIAKAAQRPEPSD